MLSGELNLQSGHRETLHIRVLPTGVRPEAGIHRGALCTVYFMLAQLTQCTKVAAGGAEDVQAPQTSALHHVKLQQQLTQACQGFLPDC